MADINPAARDAAAEAVIRLRGGPMSLLDETVDAVIKAALPFIVAQVRAETLPLPGEARPLTTTLAEFLQARIAEDKATASDERARWHAGGCWEFADTAEYGDCDCGVPARVLAEWKAKRRIIALAQADHGGDAFNRAAWEQVLLEMAATYASHPEYRVEWRP